MSFRVVMLSEHFYGWLCSVILLCSLSAFAQVPLSGKVTDLSGRPLVGVSVSESGTANGTVTNFLGAYTILIHPGATIVFSHVGFSPRQIHVDDSDSIMVQLEEETITLTELLVTGYGTALRKDVTGSIDKITQKDFIQGQILNPLQHLQGQVAGLSIVKPGGDPNGDFIVRVRGATSIEGHPPLIVVDGVAIDDSQRAISSVNPADIESYTILKDASSAAIYGSRGANGVILISTKKGKPGKTGVELNASGSFEKTAHNIDVLTSDEWRKATMELGGSDVDMGANTDWQKAISQDAFTQNYFMRMTGGDDALFITASAGYQKQEGVILNSSREVWTARLNATQSALNEKLHVIYGISGSFINRQMLPDQTSTSQAREGGAFVFLITPAISPVLPIYNSDGTYYHGMGINPVFLLNELHSEQKQNFFQGSIKSDYAIAHGLTIGSFVALSKGNDAFDRFWPKLSFLQSSGVKTSQSKLNFSGNINLAFNHKVGDHSFELTGVYEYNKFLNDGFSVSASGFNSPDLLTNNLATASAIDGIASFKNEVRLISFLGRVTYQYDDRYVITANLRKDGSSKFGVNNRWSTFPSVAIAWKLQNENFLSRHKWLNDLKLRIAYGLTGNQENLPPNKHQELYGATGPYLSGGAFRQSFGVAQENNPDLKWEVRKSLNFGLDFSFLQNKIFGTLGYFSDHSDDMIFRYNVPQPPFVASKVYANAASATNKGIELLLGGTLYAGNSFTWSVVGNISSVRNRVTKLLGEFKGVDLAMDQNYGPASGGAFGFDYVTRLTVGYPAGVFWIPEHAGIDQAGNELFFQYGEDGERVGTSTSYDFNDRVYIDPSPDFGWGLTNNFTYGKLDLQIFIRGVHGQKIFSNSLLNLETQASLPGRNVTPEALTNGFRNLAQPSTYWLRYGSYARVENISLSYRWNNFKGIANLRLFVAANNVLLLTSYKGVDPEINTDGPTRYIDGAYYPKARGITIGLTVEL